MDLKITGSARVVRLSYRVSQLWQTDRCDLQEMSLLRFRDTLQRLSKAVVIVPLECFGKCRGLGKHKVQ